MQWVLNSCYAGSLVLYLALKYYFENEIKKTSPVPDGARCASVLCYREQSSHTTILTEAAARNMLHVPSRRPALCLSTDRLHSEDQRHVCSRTERTCEHYQRL